MTQGDRPPSGTRGVTEEGCEVVVVVGVVDDFVLRRKPFSRRIPRKVRLPAWREDGDETESAFGSGVRCKDHLDGRCGGVIDENDGDENDDGALDANAW